MGMSDTAQCIILAAASIAVLFILRVIANKLRQARQGGVAQMEEMMRSSNQPRRSVNRLREDSRNPDNANQELH
jgi:hypothetical protein